jgi:uncharacterized protein YjbJ (UPF0337 family)
MDWNDISASWHQLGGAAKAYWAKLNDDDLAVINGKREQLIGVLQERYGISADQAEQQVNDWAVRMVGNIAPVVGAMASRAARPVGQIGEMIGDGIRGTVRANSYASLATAAAVGLMLGVFWNRLVR